MPGTYTAKLTIGDKSWEKPVTVRVDPNVGAAVADLRQQFDAAQKLRDMESATNQTLRYLDTVKAQLEQLQKDVKKLMPEPPAELTRTLADHLKQVEALEFPLVRGDNIPAYGEGPQLVERVHGLFSSIEEMDAAPTAPQMAFLGELQGEFDSEIAKVNAFITNEVPKLNDVLKGFGVSGVMPGKPMDLPH